MRRYSGTFICERSLLRTLVDVRRGDLPSNPGFWSTRGPMLKRDLLHACGFGLVLFFVTVSGPSVTGQTYAERLGWKPGQIVVILHVDDAGMSHSSNRGGLSAVSHRLRLTVAQEPIEEKSNEIPALQPLLRKLPKGALEGSMITADALHCQQESSKFVTQELGADYLWGLKGNQSGILERAQLKLPQRFFSL